LARVVTKIRWHESRSFRAFEEWAELRKCRLIIRADDDLGMGT
jgi:hypothetical protein